MGREGMHHHESAEVVGKCGGSKAVLTLEQEYKIYKAYK